MDRIFFVLSTGGDGSGSNLLTYFINFVLHTQPNESESGIVERLIGNWQNNNMNKTSFDNFTY